MSLQPEPSQHGADQLVRFVLDYTRERTNGDGLVATPLPGVRMMCMHRPSGPLHSIYRPLICLVLQGGKRMVVGTDERIVAGGESVLVTADMPVSGRIVRASRSAPYVAVAIELDVPLIRELDVELRARGALPSEAPPLLVAGIDSAVLDTAARLVKLLSHPEAVPILYPGTVRELHYWLLSGPHGTALRSMALPTSAASRLAKAIAILRTEYRTRLAISRLAKAAGMSSTAFHLEFKKLTTLTPVQFQKRLRLVEARRLMLHEAATATTAAFEVGYESLSQFTREYSRMFGAPPKRDTLRRTGYAGDESAGGVHRAPRVPPSRVRRSTAASVAGAPRRTP